MNMEMVESKESLGAVVDLQPPDDMEKAMVHNNDEMVQVKKVESKELNVGDVEVIGKFLDGVDQAQTIPSKRKRGGGPKNTVRNFIYKDIIGLYPDGQQTVEDVLIDGKMDPVEVKDWSSMKSKIKNESM